MIVRDNPIKFYICILRGHRLFQKKNTLGSQRGLWTFQEDAFKGSGTVMHCIVYAQEL